MTVALIDAGPLAALFEPASQAHDHYHALIAQRRRELRLHTTSPCITEAAHFLSPPKRWALLHWLAGTVVTVFPCDQPDLVEMIVPMQRYTEPPRTDMDLADASLLWVAAENGIRTILTLDVRDFSRYRLPDGRWFEIL